MPERDSIVKPQTISYRGPFSVAEVYALINTWLDDRRYDRLDKDHNEIVKPDGKYIEVSLRPEYELSTYAKFVLWIDIKMSRVKDIELEIDGHKRRLQEGDVLISVRAFLDSDIEGTWESTPLYMVIRTAFNKLVYKTSYNQYVEQLKGHVAELKDELKAFFNLYRKQTA